MRAPSKMLVLLLTVATMARAAEPEPLPAPREQPAVDLHGDPLPAGALARIGTIRFRQSWTSALAFSPDGRLLASGGGNNPIRLWDTQTGREVRAIECRCPAIQCLAFSPDGKTIATAGNEKAARLLDVATGQEIRQLEGHTQGLRIVAFAPDGQTIASGSFDGSARLWDVTTGKVLADFRAEAGGINALAFAPDGKTLATAGEDKRIRFWDLATRAELRSAQSEDRDIRGLAFSPDGKLVASAGWASKVELWDAATGKPVRALTGHPTVITGVAFAPDGKTVISWTWNDGVRIWDAATGQAVRHFGKELSPRPAALSPDGKWLATGSYRGSLLLWDTATGKLHDPAGGVAQGITQAVFAPDGHSLYTLTESRQLQRWDARHGKQLKPPPPWPGAAPRQASLSRDGRTVGLWEPDQTIRICATATGKELHRFTVEAPDVLFMPDGRAVAAVHPGALVELWPVERGKPLLPFQGRENSALHAALSHDGKSLAISNHASQTVEMWEVATSKPRWRTAVGHRSHLLAFTPDDRQLLGWGQDAEVCVFDALTGKERYRRLSADRAAIVALTVSPDGRLTAAGTAEGLVSLWRLVDGKEVCSFRGHRDGVTSLSFSPDGRRLASSSWDTTTIIWEVPPLKPDEPPAAALEAKRWSKADLAAAWTDLAGNDVARAFAAMRQLQAVPKQAVPFLEGRLRPVPGEDDEIKKLIGNLDSEKFAVRQQASVDLEKLGGRAERALLQALAGKPSLEVRSRLEAVLEKLDKTNIPQYLIPAWRSLETLERIGSPEARQLLEKLAQDKADGILQREAAAVVQRLR